MDHLLTIEGIAKYLNYSIHTIYPMVQTGQIPAYKIKGSWRFKKTEIDEWLKGKCNLKDRKWPNGMVETEKQFAIFLESQGKTWIYEPCQLDIGIPCGTLSRNQVYVPDFWCPEDCCYYEVSSSDQAHLRSMKKIKLVRKIHPNFKINIVHPNGKEYILNYDNIKEIAVLNKNLK